MSRPIEIPQPPGLPILGNALDLDSEVSLNSFIKFGDEYGEIYALRFPAGKRVFVCSAALMQEIGDESRFCKVVAGALNEMRAGVGKGLFTAHDGEKDWGIAHRILAPAFGPGAITEYFDGKLCRGHTPSFADLSRYVRTGYSDGLEMGTIWTRLQHLIR